MPLIDEIIPFLRSRSIKEGWEMIARPFKSAAAVLEQAGPAGGRLAYDIRGTEDDMARGVSQYFTDDLLPLQQWERIDPAKREAAARFQSGQVYPDDAAKFGADAEIQTMTSQMQRIAARTNEENLATTDPAGESLKVRDPFSGLWRAYEGIQENYFPRFLKREKRDAILGPIQYTQAELERSLAADLRTKQNLGDNALLDPALEQQVKTDAASAIDEYLRTGKANAVLKAPELLTEMQPAYDTFQELATHMRRLAVNEAAKTGGPIPAEVDPIVQLFGTTTPEGTQGGIKMLREYLLRDAQQARRFGSIESSRALQLPRDWYESDPLRVWPVYLMRQQRRLAEIKRFGQDNEMILDPKTGLLSRIANEQDRDYAKKVFERHMGLEPYNKSLKAQKWTDVLFATQALKLGTAQISQLGQIMNVLMETNLTPTWKALTNLGMSKDIALRSGATLTRVMDIARESMTDAGPQTGARKFTENFLKYTGFTKADLFARHVGAGAGWVHGEEMLHRLLKNEQDPHALRELRRLIPGASKDEVTWRKFLERVKKVRDATGGQVPPAELATHFTPDLEDIARTVSLNSNFRQSILDLPLWTSSPTGKMISMFRTFAYKQGNFVVKRAMDDLKNHNPRTLIALAAAGGVLGPLVSILKSIPRGGAGQELEKQKEFFSGEPKALLWKGLENIATVGAFGLFDQAGRLARGDSSFFQFLAGPLFTDMVTLGSSGFQIAGGLTGIAKPEQTGKGLNELGQFAGSHFPVIGSGVAKALRASLEPVTRDPSGVVFREGSRQFLGTEAPPIEIGSVTLPSLPVLLGLQTSAHKQRGDLMDQLKEAIGSGDAKALQKILQQARAAGIQISPTSVNRLMKDHLEEQAGV